MLAELRQALADTLRRGIPAAHVEAYPVDDYVDNPSGVHLAVEGDPNAYLTAWRTFGAGGRGTVRLVVAVTVSDSVSPRTALALIDDMLDPLSTLPNIFAAVMGDPTLGITAYEVYASPDLTDVGAPQKVLVGNAEANVIRWRADVPVEITVERS